jgi:hypothetical protein
LSVDQVLSTRDEAERPDAPGENWDWLLEVGGLSCCMPRYEELKA